MTLTVREVTRVTPRGRILSDNLDGGSKPRRQTLMLIECACCAAASFTIQGELLELFTDRVSIADREAALTAISDQPAV